MRMSRLVGRQIKEAPKDAQTASHIFMIRGGFVRPVSAGIYTLLPLGKRVTTKIEAIIRDEMNRIEGQELMMPVVLPRELWEETGRYDSVGSELLRVKDRNDKDMLLAMTHEEGVCHIARTEISSYKQLPAMLYQIQTKYRDEARPRAGLIRVREFTMKDGYSFHVDQECLEAYYERAHEAYVRIFKRIGMPSVVSIESDTGMMGGSIAHEFMALADCGGDTLFLSPDGTSYKANREVARTALTFEGGEPMALEKVHTPGQKSIEDVTNFVKLPTTRAGKAVFYRDSDGKLVFAVIRGDLDVNEGKLRKVVGSALELAYDAEIEAVGCVPGYASPLGVDPTKCRIVFDPSAVESANLVVGANETDYHLLNFNFARDMASVADQVIISDIATARAGDPCPVTGEPLVEQRGIEVGNIFQLGTKYSAAMGCNFLNQQGKSLPLIMGCYGIGVGRAAAAVIEQCHDDRGPIWPISVAPYEVHIVGLNHNKEVVSDVCGEIYADLLAAGIEVLYDDRNKRGGFAFADAELIGCPFRITVAPRGLKEDLVEMKTRDGSVDIKVNVTDIAADVIKRVLEARADAIL
ncbi:MAG: proline--tRNA ligase [Rhodobacterales bacterium]|nr:proline--tRNA ligase [Rhodobacterales bacterium]